LKGEKYGKNMGKYGKIWVWGHAIFKQSHFDKCNFAETFHGELPQNFSSGDAFRDVAVGAWYST